MSSRIDSLTDPKVVPPPWNIILPLIVRAGVWGAIFAILYLLRAFFLLIFLTFVFAYLQANGVVRLKRFIPNRSVRVVLVGLFFLSVLLAMGNFLVPRVRDQARIFVQRYPSYVRTLDQGLLDLAKAYPTVEGLVPVLADYRTKKGDQLTDWRLEESLSSQLLQDMVGLGGESSEVKSAHTMERLQKVGSGIVATLSSFLLSLLFSFLIVLDLPRLTRGAKSLESTRLRFVYKELASGVREFGLVVGRAFEAQMVIALLNTVLTGAGIYLLGIGEKVAFLSVIVFFCSFIPVAGVFISSVPICLLTLQESGFTYMLLAVGLITVTHMIEAYILNPKIYGHHLRLHPVIVLIILTTAGKLFGVWGLVLGVPICSYIFGHAIRYQDATSDSARL